MSVVMHAQRILKQISSKLNLTVTMLISKQATSLNRGLPALVLKSATHATFATSPPPWPKGEIRMGARSTRRASHRRNCDDLKQHFLGVIGGKSTLNCDFFASIDSEESLLGTYRHIAKARGSYKPASAKKEDSDVPTMLPSHRRKRYFQLCKQYDLMQAGHKNTTEK